MKKYQKILAEKKNIIYSSFIVVIVFSFFWNHIINSDKNRLAIRESMKMMNMDLKEVISSNTSNIDFAEFEEDSFNPTVIKKIEHKLSRFLYGIQNYHDLKIIKPYLKLRPGVLNRIPSMTPLFKNEYKVSSPYGNRFHPKLKRIKKHKGYDLAAPLNSKVYATADGIVIRVQKLKTGYGKNILIKNSYGFQTLYGHLNRIKVEKGEIIKQGDIIGLVGSTGMSTGPHLHYEILKNNKAVNPYESFSLKYQILKQISKQKNNEK